MAMKKMRELESEKAKKPGYLNVENEGLRSLLATLSREASKPVKSEFIRPKDLGTSEKELKVAFLGMVGQFPKNI